MKIAFFELEDFEKEYFEKKLKAEHELVFFDDTLNNVEISTIKDIEIAVIFIYSNINKEILDSLLDLKFVATMSTGTDHIDLKECKKRGIGVSSVPTYGEYTVAEHTFALILAVSRRLIDSYKKIREWRFSPDGLTGFDLHGKTIGVIGVGNIGQNVIKIAKGFNMDVLGYNRTQDPQLEEKLGFQYVELDILLSQSDIISLHLPYCPDTHHFLNKERFEKMKDGVVIINTARGGLIDTEALIEALTIGKVKAAGLDVLEKEPLLREEKELLSNKYKKEDLVSVMEDHFLISHPNVVVTPHNAFNSHEALLKIIKTTEDNISSFIQGNPKNSVIQCPSV